MNAREVFFLTSVGRLSRNRAVVPGYRTRAHCVWRSQVVACIRESLTTHAMNPKKAKRQAGSFLTKESKERQDLVASLFGIFTIRKELSIFLYESGLDGIRSPRNRCCEDPAIYAPPTCWDRIHPNTIRHAVN